MLIVTFTLMGFVFGFVFIHFMMKAIDANREKK